MAPLTLVLILASLVGMMECRSWRQSPTESFFGEATTDLTIAILQSDISNNRNLVFSPLGYSAILAILAEGARGNTRNQLVKALRLPEDTYAVRSTYKSVLSNMQEHYVINKPEFKNWFYVYKNYTVEESYKKILSDSYLTYVKEIERDYYYSSSSSGVKDESKKEMEKLGDNNKKSEIKEENKESESESGMNKETEMTDEKVMKTDMVKVDDKVEGNKKKVAAVGNGSKKNELVTARNIQQDGSEVQMEKEILSALSANRLSSLNQTADGDNNEEKSDSRMIIFNALYFRGNWSVPFTKKAKKEAFYLSETEKKQVEMVSSEGEFEYGQIAELDATAIELPYQGGRYSLLVLIPNSRNGLKKLQSGLTRDCLRDINKYLSKTQVEVCIPKFKFYSISRPKSALTKCGVTDIFNNEADLSGITGMKGLYLDDLVQLVTLEVDESSSSYNFLTSSAAATRSAVVKFKADQPFVFLLRDRVENFVVVAGRLQDPTDSNEELKP
ncbi:hypothetical protein O3M35_003652 [Rhynocoris fuscipes]|uniref:Serpin domain-containing protein n=1 Tax=Rhynocoris fuscipes TaxID=488301 RepID=A0AAW1CNR5_9HEMI